MRFLSLAVTVQVMVILAVLAFGVPPLLSMANTLGVLYGVSLGALCLLYLIFVFPWVVSFLWKRARNEPSPGNQCDGCQAGVPVDDKGNHRMGSPGGYADLMRCEKGRYVSEPAQGPLGYYDDYKGDSK
jgi:hypothetical protein